MLCFFLGFDLGMWCEVFYFFEKGVEDCFRVEVVFVGQIQ